MRGFSFDSEVFGFEFVGGIMDSCLMHICA
jgi:hypothetical protein